MHKPVPIVPTSSIWGHLPNYKKNPIAFLSKQIEAHGDIFSFRVLHRNLIFINHPDHLKHILQQNHRNYIKNLGYRKLRLMLGNGLLTSEGDFWAKQRKLMQPAFYRQEIEGFLGTMDTVAGELIANWKAETANGLPISVGEHFVDATLKIISNTMLGVSISGASEVIKKYFPPAMQFMIKRIFTLVNTPMWVPTPQNLLFRRNCQAIHQLVTNIIEQKKQTDYQPQNLLSMLMSMQDEDTGEKMSDAQLLNEVITIFLAGHETTALAMTWVLFLLAKYPQVQAKLRQEIQASPKDATVSVATTQQMPYLQAVIKETMRLYPPFWIWGREAIASDNINGYHIPKGASIILSPYCLHRHRDFWQNPDEFIPERFLEKATGQGNSSMAYLPFGSGVRMCIGKGFAMLEMEILLLRIMQNFVIKPFVEPFEMGFEFSLTLRPEKSVLVNLETI